MNELTAAAISGLEATINQYLSLDPETLQRMARLEGKVIAIRLRDTELTLYMLPTGSGVQLFVHYEGEPDTILDGTPLGLARMGLSKDASNVMFEGDVVIKGDVELGQRFKRILDSMDIDWEEHLSHITGDIVAHKLGNLARDGLQWGANLLNTLARDVGEYLQEESRDVVGEAELTPFLNKVDTLRDDTERLTARVKRLQQKLTAQDEE